MDIYQFKVVNFILIVFYTLYIYIYIYFVGEKWIKTDWSTSLFNKISYNRQLHSTSKTFRNSFSILLKFPRTKTQFALHHIKQRGIFTATRHTPDTNHHQPPQSFLQHTPHNRTSKPMISYKSTSWNMGVDRRGNDTASAMTHNPQLQYNCQLKKRLFNSVTCLISQLLLKIPVFYRHN